jgi:hypothetical protein
MRFLEVSLSGRACEAELRGEPASWRAKKENGPLRRTIQ